MSIATLTSEKSKQLVQLWDKDEYFLYPEIVWLIQSVSK